MQHTFLENNKILEALDTTAGGTTDVNGATVDMGQDGGFDSISFGVRMGSYYERALSLQSSCRSRLTAAPRGPTLPTPSNHHTRQRR